MELLYTNTDLDTSFLFLMKLGIVLNAKKKALSGIPQMKVNKIEDKIIIIIGTSEKKEKYRVLTPEHTPNKTHLISYFFYFRKRYHCLTFVPGTISSSIT